METIAQLQSKLQEAADLLASVTRELDAHRNAGAAAESFDFARLRCDAENHPYTGHPAARSSMPELYYLLLLTILTTAEAKEAQWLHLYRIAKGADYAQDVHDLLPAAHAITDARMVECIECIRRDNLTRAFLLDAMILTLLREEEDTSLLEYIAGLAALMDVSQQKITSIIQMARCIVEQNTEDYFEILSNAPVLRKESSFYFPQIVDDLDSASQSDHKHIIFVGVSKQAMHINMDEWKAERISFMMCFFDRVTFESKHKHIDFFDCTFKNVYNVCCIDINKGTIKDCSFMNCKADKYARVIHLSNVEITNTEFKSCFCDDTSGGALFLIENTIMSGCKFMGCKIQCESNSSPTSIVRAIKGSLVQNCTFNDCKVRGWYIFDNIEKHSILRLYNSTQKNNRFTKCIGTEIK